MDKIQEMLQRLQELSEAELAELEGLILKEFESVEKQDVSPDVVQRMQQLADSADAVKAEATRRQEAASELAQAAQAAAERVRGTTQADTAVSPAAAETEAEATEAQEEPAAAAASTQAPQGSELSAKADEPPAASAAPTPAPEPASSELQVHEAPSAAPVAEAGKEPGHAQEEPVTAAVESPTATTIEVPADRTARPRAQAAVTIIAGGDIPGVTAGAQLPDIDAIANAMSARMHAMRRTSGGNGEQHTVATLVASFPEERTLREGQFQENRRKVDEVTSVTAITAAGGICAPVDVRYDIWSFNETTDRPAKDALASFQAARGGIRWITPPVLTDLTGAVSLWTLQDDIDAATAGAPDPVKPCLRVGCGSEVTVYVDAIPLCMTFGNMGARAYPELIKRHTELAMVWQARYAETRLLTRIGALSTQVTASHVLGFTVDWLNQADRAAVALRSRHRLDPNFPLRVLAPWWLKAAIRSDIAMRMPGGNGVTDNLAVADNMIDQFMAARNVTVAWFLDGETGQVFGAQGAGALLGFPSSVIWYVFPEGTFLFLDGGTLDLGLVRDSTLNGTNDYKMFVETFEGVAMIGIESMRITSPLAITGGVAGTVVTNAAPGSPYPL